MIYVFLAEGFEEIEALSTVDVLRRANCNLKTVSVVESKVVTGANGIQVVADINYKDIILKDIEAIVLPGGMPGVLNLEKSQEVNNAIDYCIANNKYIAAICAAPSVLGKKGLLKDIKATCFPGFEDFLIGANFSDNYICVDKNIITAKGPGVSIEFALEIVKIIYGKEKSKEIRKSMQCR